MPVIVDYPAHAVILRLLKKERRSLLAKAIWWDAHYEPDTDGEANWRDWQVAHWRCDAAHMERLIAELEGGHDEVCLLLRRRIDARVRPRRQPGRRRAGTDNAPRGSEPVAAGAD